MSYAVNRSASSGGGGIPKRWLHCPRKGTVVGDVFLPFKTPLDERYSGEVPDANLFSPQMVLDYNYGNRKIGLWINLTFTDRFYDSNIVESRQIDSVSGRHVQYTKLACRGFKQTPTEDQVDAFIRVCRTFLSSNPNDIIAVHCTHGFNRTGFLICSYLVQVENWDILAAVKEFSQHRPPGIYKQDYLNDLFKRYGDPDDEVPKAPDLPEWCLFEEEGPDDESSNSHGASHNGRPAGEGRAGFVKKNATFMSGVGGVTVVTNFSEVKRVRSKIQSILAYKGPIDNFPGAQPVSMMSSNLSLLKPDRYMVSWKADGVRYMCLIEGKGKVFFTDRDFSIFQIEGLKFPSPKDYRNDHLVDTLVDGEMVLDEDPSNPNGKTPRYLIYDIICYGNDMIGLRDFDIRFKAIVDIVINPRHKAINEGLLDRSREPFGVRRKEFYHLSVTEKVIAMKTGHEHDGLIFQPIKEPYKSGTCQSILKWKPPHLNTIDFKLHIRKFEQAGCITETFAFLFVQGCEQPWARIKINKTNREEMKEYDGKVVECECLDLRTNSWKIMRIRTDKSHPNHVRVAENISRSISDNLTEKNLLEVIRQMTAGQQKQQQQGVKRKGAPSDSSSLMPPPPPPPKF